MEVKQKAREEDGVLCTFGCILHVLAAIESFVCKGSFAERRSSCDLSQSKQYLRFNRRHMERNGNLADPNAHAKTKNKISRLKSYRCRA